MLRDARSGFIAYVPVGSIKKGEALVMKGGAGKTTACTICHAADLQGLGPVPGLAGRSPSYLVRQMYDIQHEFRSGSWTSLMKPVVANLTSDDMLSIAAFLASRGVPAAEPNASRQRGTAPARCDPIEDEKMNGPSRTRRQASPQGIAISRPPLMRLRLLMPPPKVVLVAGFEVPAESVLRGGPEHEVQHGFTTD